LCWHCCPCCDGIVVLVALVLLLSVVWSTTLWLSTCQLNKGEDACELTAWQKYNKGKEDCTTRALMPVYQWQQYQHDKGNLDDSKDACALMMATTPL
jgi:hypothetical protein